MRGGIVVLVALGVGGCLRGEPEPPEDPVRFEGWPLDAGERVQFTFPADGVWHETPYVTYYGHVMEIQPVGRGLMLPDLAIQFRIGGSVQTLGSQRRFRVTRPGSLAFRTVPQLARGYEGEVEVEIHRSAEGPLPAEGAPARPTDPPADGRLSPR